MKLLASILLQNKFNPSDQGERELKWIHNRKRKTFFSSFKNHQLTFKVVKLKNNFKRKIPKKKTPPMLTFKDDPSL
jgi:hypothetical protein